MPPSRTVQRAVLVGVLLGAVLLSMGVTTRFPSVTLQLPTNTFSYFTASVAAPNDTGPSYLRAPMCSTPIATFHFKRQTKCVADFMFVNIWAQFRPPSMSSWTVVDVGANKGYTIIGILNGIGVTTYNGSQNYASLDTFVRREGLVVDPHLMCGVCKDCHEVFDPYGSRHTLEAVSKVRVFAFDPIRAHAKYLSEAFKSDDRIQFSVRHMALGHAPGTAVFGFEGNSFGREEMGVAEANKTKRYRFDASRLYNVSVSTLDAELRNESIDFIDVLVTDTEGNDYKVAEGAQEWINAGRVGLYMFELGVDPERHLGQHIRRLERAGYRCFAPIEGSGATQISHECWNPKWENIGGWMNVVCANERLPHLLEAMYTINTFIRPPVRRKSHK